jgi:DNA-directed RNA polymerase subunit RPC12/RpoP
MLPVKEDRRGGTLSKIRVDVTHLVDTGPVDDECLPLLKCICGQKFDMWSIILSIYEDEATECPHCRRKFIFNSSVRVYQVLESTDGQD